MLFKVTEGRLSQRKRARGERRESEEERERERVSVSVSVSVRSSACIDRLREAFNDQSQREQSISFSC